MTSNNTIQTEDNLLAKRLKILKSGWPDRYYGLVDPDTSHPAQVMGWIDAWDSANDPDVLSAASSMLPLTPEQWEWHLQSGNSQAQLSANGTLSRYVPPPPPPASLKDQAQNAMQQVRQQASMVTAMGEIFGPDMRTYVKVLRSIINGTDTISTTLPTPPEDPTD